MSKRKAFNFFQSYYDVYVLLKTDKEKACFMDALLRKQFEGIEPELSSMPNMAAFAYKSQKFSIDRQVKGWLDKVNGMQKNTPNEGGLTTPSDGESDTPTEQEEEKGKGKEGNSTPLSNSDSTLQQRLDFFRDEFNKIRKEYVKNARQPDWTDKGVKNFKKLKFDRYTRGDIRHAIRQAFNDPNHKETEWKYVTLEFLTREDILERYVHDVSKPEKDHSELTNEEKALKYLV